MCLALSCTSTTLIFCRVDAHRRLCQPCPRALAWRAWTPLCGKRVSLASRRMSPTPTPIHACSLAASLRRVRAAGASKWACTKQRSRPSRSAYERACMQACVHDRAGDDIKSDSCAAQSRWASGLQPKVLHLRKADQHTGMRVLGTKQNQTCFC